MADDDVPAAGEVMSAEDTLDFSPKDESDGDEATCVDGNAEPSRLRSPTTAALVAGLIAIVALGSLCGWLGVRAYHSRQFDERQALFVEVARQGAVNLTTIDHRQVDGDVKRILDSATGSFYDDFNDRAQPFVEVVKKAQSKSVGTVVSAGVESETDQDAQVLVAVSVKTTLADGAEQQPRSWRMRISVQKLGDDVKVSNVSFVP